jgi:hypothetical protein
VALLGLIVVTVVVVDVIVLVATRVETKGPPREIVSLGKAREGKRKGERKRRKEKGKDGGE